MKVIFLIIIFITSIPYVKAQSLVINELMSSNNNFLLDEDGDDSDWIELYNNSSQTIHLNDYYLSDKADNLLMWALPNIDILPNQFILIFASGKNRAIPNNELHTNFSIKSEGESIFLTYQGNIVHSAPSIDLPSNKSYGLISDGGSDFIIFNTPSPKTTNNTSSNYETLTFSHLGGIYDDVFQLNIIENNVANNIYYTTDGTTPTINSLVYQTPLQLNSTLFSTANISQKQLSPIEFHDPPPIQNVLKSIVIRAAAFNTTGELVSEISTHTYFIKTLGNQHNDLPILSIIADSSELFNYETGIFVPGRYWEEDHPDWTGNYFQKGREWEKSAHFEYYEQNIAIRQNVGLRTHGGNSRRNIQKGMRLYARNEYNNNRFNYAFFPEKSLDSYKRLVLKPFTSSWSEGGLEDYLGNQLALSLDIDGIGVRPVSLYLNGEYWGIYFLQERVDQYYIEDNFHENKDSIDIIENWFGGVAVGDWGDFARLYDFVQDNDFSIPSNYDQIKNLIDIEDFIDYQLFEIFLANYDWPANNMKCWKPKRENSKWRWIFFDNDAGLRQLDFDGFENALSIEEDDFSTNPRSTLFLRKFLANEEFKDQFFKRLENLLQNQLNYSASKPFYQKIIAEIGSEINNQINRFSIPLEYNSWLENITLTSEFLNERACILQKQVEKRFDKKLMIDDCSSIKKIDITDLIIYPNPNNGVFTFSFNSTSTEAGILLITNSLGQLIDTKGHIITSGINQVFFNQNNLPNGIIFLTILTNNQVFRAKMIKNN